MAALSEILEPRFVERFLVEENNRYEDLVEEIKNQFPGVKGCSLRSVKRFCSQHGIKKHEVPVSNEMLDGVVQRAISEVGPVYGRKMLKGYIDQKVNRAFASERRVGSSLRRVAPYYHNHRQRGTERQLNPQPYTAEYHGHKLHMDQNEKLAAYGVVHVCAIDGYSRYIPAFACMPVKNNVIIYNDVYRKAVIEDCLPDQLRVDHGREFYLSLFVQESIADLRTNTERDPHRRTESKKNLRIERFWVEVNARVNYPIKNALRNMEDSGIIDMELEATKFFVSNVTLKMAKVGMQRTVSAWNHHFIPGVGKPVQLRDNNFQGQRLSESQVPSSDEAVTSYEDLGGSLTLFPCFGADPLANDTTLQAEREQNFDSVTDFEAVFGELVNGNPIPFETAIVRYANMTIELVT